MKCKNYGGTGCLCNNGVDMQGACFYPGGKKPPGAALNCKEYKPWPEIDMVFFKEFLIINNMIAFRKKTQEDFNKFVIDNKEKFNNPDYMQVFAENVQLFDKEFYKANFEMCKVFYDFMQAEPGWIHLNFGLRTSIRLESFEDSFKNFLNDGTDRLLEDILKEKK